MNMKRVQIHHGNEALDFRGRESLESQPLTLRFSVLAL